jgi:hypothetical protein
MTSSRPVFGLVLLPLPLVSPAQAAYGVSGGVGTITIET